VTKKELDFAFKDLPVLALLLLLLLRRRWLMNLPENRSRGEIQKAKGGERGQAHPSKKTEATTRSDGEGAVGRRGRAGGDSASGEAGEAEAAAGEEVAAREEGGLGSGRINLALMGEPFQVKVNSSSVASRESRSLSRFGRRAGISSMSVALMLMLMFKFRDGRGGRHVGLNVRTTGASHGAELREGTGGGRSILPRLTSVSWVFLGRNGPFVVETHVDPEREGTTPRRQSHLPRLPVPKKAGGAVPVLCALSW
jgi:hypothetical protein